MVGWRACLAYFVLPDAKGLGTVGERSTETAVSVERYQADRQGERGYSIRSTNCCRNLEGALRFGLPVFFPWFLVLLCSQVSTRVSLKFFFFFLLVLFKCPPDLLGGGRGGGGGRIFFFFVFFFFFFSCDFFFFFLCFQALLFLVLLLLPSSSS